MDRTAWLAPVVNHRLVRNLADAGSVRLAHYRVRELDRLDAARCQANILTKLVRYAQNTRFGKDHDFRSIRSVADYQARVPVREYEYFWNTYWKDAYPNFDDITWPGKIPYYALSSGTTSGGTKYIPVSHEMVKSNRKAAQTTMALFRHTYPEHRIFNGKFFFLGGNTDMKAHPNGSLYGDLSAIAAREIPEAVRPYTFPPLELSRIPDWKEKIRRFAEVAVRERITAMSGVPSWMVLLFDQMKQITGKATISEIWPEFRLLIHGGTKFDSYRELFQKEIGGDRFQFCEVYPCSEGFIATEDPRHKLLRLVPDHDIFFEFIPVAELGKERAARHTVANLELGVNYAVVLTSCAGVWSYLVGDTVRFVSRTPLLLEFTGRTKYFLSAFGEHLISEEVEKGIAHAAKACGTFAVEHHVGPVFPTEPKKPGFHRYLVEFNGPPPDLARFAQELDRELIRLNEDYEAHRANDLTMLIPEVLAVRAGGFRAMMEARKSDFDFQGKVPRMDNGGKLTAEMFQWLLANGKMLS